MPDKTAPTVDWDALVTVTARRGDVAAAAQALGYGNNLSDEATAFQETLNAALSQPEHQGEIGTPRNARTGVGALSDEEREEARSALADFDTHGDYEAPIASLRRIVQKLPALPAAVPSKPSVLEEERDLWMARFDQAVADCKREEVECRAAGAALEELAAEFEKRAAEEDALSEAAEEHGEPVNAGHREVEANTFREAARRCREKAAALKGGEAGV
jgi:hypothetical protein